MACHKHYLDPTKESNVRPPIMEEASLVIFHGEEQEIMTFCPITGGEVVHKELPHGLRNKRYTVHFDGWLAFWTKDESPYELCLWNAVTMENPIYFPKLNLKQEQKINYAVILTAAPGTPDCMLVVFETSENGPSLSYCRERDEDWTNHSISDDKLSPETNMSDPVTCNGKIYCFCFGRDDDNLLAMIDIKQDGLNYNFLELKPYHRRGHGGDTVNDFFVESHGELFMIRLGYNRVNSQLDYHLGVRDIEVWKVDDEGQCHLFDSFEDTAFFVGPSSQFSCPVYKSGGIKGNHVYFTLSGDWSVYAFDMKDETVLFSKALQDIPEGCFTSFWLKTGSRPSNNNFIKDVECDESTSKETIREGEFSKLPPELLAEIGLRLQLTEYMSFRTVGTSFRAAEPVKRWAGFAGNVSSLPLLMSLRPNNVVNAWKFVDPLCNNETYYMTQNNHLEDAVMCYSKGGWCILVHGEYSIFLWNPFTKKTIQLPALLTSYVSGCSFSSPPDCPELDCTIVVLLPWAYSFTIGFIKLGDEEWEYHDFKTDKKWGYVTFCKGAIYCLDEDGDAGVYKIRGGNRDEEEGHENEEDHGVNGDAGGDEHDGEGHGVDGDANGDEHDVEGDGSGDEDDIDYEVLNHIIEWPYESFHQKFLLECDDRLFSVFVGFLGKTVRVFKLDESQMSWTEVENLGNYIFYVSQFSAFSTAAPTGMGNRIYFPRYYGDNSVIFYSLKSRKFHSHEDTGKILEDFYNTKEHLLCGWVTPAY